MSRWVRSIAIASTSTAARSVPGTHSAPPAGGSSAVWRRRFRAMVVGVAPGGRLDGAVARVLVSVGAEAQTPMLDELRAAAADAELDAGVFNPEVAPSEQSFAALVFDASGITSTDELREAWAFFHPTI